MNVATILAMACAADEDRLAIGRKVDGANRAILALQASAAAERIKAAGAEHVVFLGVNSLAWPVTLFGRRLLASPWSPSTTASLLISWWP